MFIACESSSSSSLSLSLSFLSLYTSTSYALSLSFSMTLSFPPSYLKKCFLSNCGGNIDLPSHTPYNASSTAIKAGDITKSFLRVRLAFCFQAITPNLQGVCAESFHAKGIRLIIAPAVQVIYTYFKDFSIQSIFLVLKSYQ